LDLTAGVTNGWVFGHAHVEGSAPKTPTHYFKASTYLELPADGGVQISANYLGRKNSENARTSLLGLDFVAKWRDAARLAFLLQGEVWHRWTGSASGKVDRELGAYIFPQVGLTQQWYLGARLDAFSNLNKVDNLSRSQSNLDLAVVPALTYRPSEFATIRLSYNHEAALLQGAPSVHQKMIEFQAVFILGAHPAHDF
jgi:hypothetical protein